MKTQLQLSVDENIKKTAMDIYQDLGLTLSNAVNVFLKKSISVGGFPFDVRKSQFVLRMDEASKEYEAFLSEPEKYKRYESAHDMFEDILSEILDCTVQCLSKGSEGRKKTGDGLKTA